ncbi:hypothetical protein P8629_05535 [Hydrogenovibrio sp. 3SP14C1]|uniref:hypothetical protein n=1 Tax=Hydrogenovibrio sp. 3SP14C1 TaxID=3038774 RepID=UPI002417C92C|nr:hypothetical protein [Hydrogenovibrio sp. 3SP14C1]MDG4812463.1 hypothetical protein [Hydrogenovibrio sp. 3SP14C1]
MNKLISQEQSSVDTEDSIQAYKSLAKREQEHTADVVKREREYSNVVAAAAVAEYKTKVKLISTFQKGTADYATMVLQLKNEISDLEGKIQNLNKSLAPNVLTINALKDDIDKLLFLYKDRNHTFEKLVGEIENLIFEYSKKIDSEEVAKIVDDKKRGLQNLCDDIERLERDVLKKEQEKLAREHEIQASLDELSAHELELAFLKNKKDKKEIEGLFSMLHQSFDSVGEVGQNDGYTNQEKEREITGEVIDVPLEKIENK